MQVTNRWNNTKLIMLNNKPSIDDGIPSQIEQKLFLKVVTCVGDCYYHCYRHGIFHSTDKYSI